jgi:hypothetical protein
VYEALIPLVTAEEAVRDGRPLSPAAVRAAAVAAGATPEQVAVAEAKARLARATQEKGF